MMISSASQIRERIPHTQIHFYEILFDDNFDSAHSFGIQKQNSQAIRRMLHTKMTAINGNIL